MLRLPLTLLALGALIGCSETQYFAPPPVTSDLRLNVRADTVQISEVSIPEYAVNQEIPLQREDGSLVTDTGKLWADLPDRAMAGSLARHLNQITDAAAAVEPWPLSGFPEVEVTVFVEDMIVRADGQLRLRGSYALRREEGRGRVETFDLFVPVVDDSYVTIIAAHEAAWLRLAEDIARKL
ncbi:hypothetical protein JANAI62_34210 [Jannaschia pagri]|uniref:ABC-type transport auxiliary lipoprotein component domain-containing protein n=1 Tax=Jannaschia pagri TaxID=2829797 RepID=A0ABQ4NR02_9RHOB|nr:MULTISPECIES: PqiC family protein [unclassified Jannaschia]GIT92963.1 hypothetical protein JANAI61_34210 [Jannaschia sp. AI_61]GIT96798.1 hypothetical protein JANAI62_34210 [Jannaschia sp. AI_62]